MTRNMLFNAKNVPTVVRSKSICRVVHMYDHFYDCLSYFGIVYSLLTENCLN